MSILSRRGENSSFLLGLFWTLPAAQLECVRGAMKPGDEVRKGKQKEQMGRGIKDSIYRGPTLLFLRLSLSTGC